jgi:hypothetical protein
VFREYHIVPHSWGSKEISMWYRQW